MRFQKEAYFRENYFYNGDYLGSEIYALLPSDFIKDSKKKLLANLLNYKF